VKRVYLDGEKLAGDPTASNGAPLIAPGKIVAVGLNYLDHIRETGLERPTRPLIFAKFPSSLIGDGDPIVIDPGLTERVDWEVELAVIIGTRARSVSEARALDHVFGYAVASDVSARDIQFSEAQWVRAKSLDTFCPLGPEIITVDEIPDPQRLGLRTRVNSQIKQESSTACMIFSVAELIEYCSRSFTLEPGDIIITGTPWGCGEFSDPVEFLRSGDVLESEIDGIGTLTNPVISV